MISACKFCEHPIPVPKLGNDYWCLHCQYYSLVMDSELSGIAESESLRVGNYYLNFFPQNREGNVVETNKDGNHRIIHTFSMNELTHELAVQWVKKLKTYVVFQ